MDSTTIVDPGANAEAACQAGDHQKPMSTENRRNPRWMSLRNFN
jgi:hypothetical protein